MGRKFRDDYILLAVLKPDEPFINEPSLLLTRFHVLGAAKAFGVIGSLDNGNDKLVISSYSVLIEQIFHLRI